LEKFNSIPISYLYINKTYNLKLFEELLNKLHSIHQIEFDNKLKLDEYKLNYTLKIKKRFEDKEIYNFENADLLYEKILTRLNTYLNSKNFKDNIVSVIHGDFWFSNILLSYKDEYKFIDMKGIINNTKSLSGDKLYDYAKILQSLVGFDAILYDKEIDSNYNLIFVEHFKNWLKEHGIIGKDVKLICALLMFGVFHAYKDMKEEKKIKIIKMIEILIGGID
jgi:thiamine kinase-like enzyme